MNGDAIRKNIIYTALVFPAALYAFLLFLDAFLIGLGSAGAVPVGTFLAIGALWSGINVPLTIVGGWMGVKKGVSCRREPGPAARRRELTRLECPCRSLSTSLCASIRSRGRSRPCLGGSSPSRPPSSRASFRSVRPCALLLALSFSLADNPCSAATGAGFIEISQIARAIFGSKLYYAFGFLCLASAIVGVTAALTTVLFAYFHLCAEDYRCVPPASRHRRAVEENSPLS